MAGTTQTYYNEHPEARKVKAKQQKKFNAQPKEIARRVKQNKLALQIGKKGDGQDISHRKNGSVFLEAQSKNRARNRGRA